MTTWPDRWRAPFGQCLHSSKASFIARSFLLPTSSFYSDVEYLWDKKAYDWIVAPTGSFCDRSTPTPTPEASTSKWKHKQRHTMGAELKIIWKYVKVSWALAVHFNLVVAFLVREGQWWQSSKIFFYRKWKSTGTTELPSGLKLVPNLIWLESWLVPWWSYFQKSGSP